MITPEEIARIEGLAYPPHMRMMAGASTWDQIREYADSDRLLVLGEAGRWYCLIGRHGRRAEIVDLAKVPGTGPAPWRSILRELQRSGVRTVELDAREGASYEVVRFLAARLGARIVECDEAGQDWGGETMHYMVVDLPAPGR